MIREQQGTRNHGGIVFTPLTEGGFYRACGPGEWRDSVTGIAVAGFVVEEMDPIDRTIKKIRLRPPTQVWTHKISYDPKDRTKRIVVPFREGDEMNAHEALEMAANAGAIELVSDEECERLWPEAFKARKSELIFNPFNDHRNERQTPLTDLIAAAKADIDAARERNAEAHAAAKSAAK